MYFYYLSTTTHIIKEKEAKKNEEGEESEEAEGMEREGRMRKEEKEGRDCSRRKISWSSLSIM